MSTRPLAVLALLPILGACAPEILADADSGANGPSTGTGGTDASGTITGTTSIGTTVTDGGSTGGPPECGNGVVEVGEQCDDGNLNDQDACRIDCTPAACGDGVVWVGMEECDDGNASDNDGCISTCTVANCGDGFIFLGEEECDDGVGDNDGSYGGCEADCTRAPYCGDGVINGSETCDFQASTDCTIGCVPYVCDPPADANCVATRPRVMIVLDASSSMLNDPTPLPAPEGETLWDAFRLALASTLSHDLGGGIEVGEQALVSTTVFGSSADLPSGAEEEVLVTFAPCPRARLEWALDPWTSCEAPGCADPWLGPPIEWTTKGPSSDDYPGYAPDTSSHMPRCDPDAGGHCVGSSTAVHLGVELAREHITAYRANPLDAADDSTPYAAIIVTEGDYKMAYSDVPVRDALQGLFTDGVDTYVVGVGELAQEAVLENMACWASGGSGLSCIEAPATNRDAILAKDQAELEAALQTIFAELIGTPC